MMGHVPSNVTAAHIHACPRPSPVGALQDIWGVPSLHRLHRGLKLAAPGPHSTCRDVSIGPHNALNIKTFYIFFKKSRFPVFLTKLAWSCRGLALADKAWVLGVAQPAPCLMSLRPAWAALASP